MPIKIPDTSTNAEIISNLYYLQKLSMARIGHRLHYSGTSVHSFMVRNRLQIRKRGGRRLDKPTINEEEIVKMYKEQHATLDSIKKQFHISMKPLIAILVKHNVYIRSHKEQTCKIPRTEQTKQLLQELYHNNNKTLKEIGDLFGVHDTVILHLMKYYNIPRRTQNKTTKPYTLPSGRIIKLQGWEGLFLDFVFKNQIFKEEEIDYNPKRILYNYNNNEHYYYPDFFIPKLNLIIEIKSTWTLKHLQTVEQNKQKEIACKQQNFNYTLLLDNDFNTFRETIKQYTI